MREQFELFKKEEEKKFIGKMPKGKIPTPKELEEYDKASIGEDDKLSTPESKEKNKQAAKKTFKEVREM
jgi:hypothetical protein